MFMMANPLGWEHTTGHSDHDRDILDLLRDDQDIVAFANTESDAAPIETLDEALRTEWWNTLGFSESSFKPELEPIMQRRYPIDYTPRSTLQNSHAHYNPTHHSTPHTPHASMPITSRYSSTSTAFPTRKTTSNETPISAAPALDSLHVTRRQLGVGMDAVANSTARSHAYNNQQHHHQQYHHHQHAHSGQQEYPPQLPPATHFNAFASSVNGNSSSNNNQHSDTHVARALRMAANAAAAAVVSSPSGNGGQAMMMAASADLMTEGSGNGCGTTASAFCSPRTSMSTFASARKGAHAVAHVQLAASAAIAAATPVHGSSLGKAKTKRRRSNSSSPIGGVASLTIKSKNQWSSIGPSYNGACTYTLEPDSTQPGGPNRKIKVGGEWSRWVLECSAKARNTAIREFGLSNADVVDLKKTSRRMKLLFGQRRYLAGLRKREAVEEQAKAEGRPPPPHTSPLGSPPHKWAVKLLALDT